MSTFSIFLYPASIRLHHRPRTLRSISGGRSRGWLCSGRVGSRPRWLRTGLTCLWSALQGTCLYPAGPGPRWSGFSGRPAETRRGGWWFSKEKKHRRNEQTIFQITLCFNAHGKMRIFHDKFESWHLHMAESKGALGVVSTCQSDSYIATDS